MGPWCDFEYPRRLPEKPHLAPQGGVEFIFMGGCPEATCSIAIFQSSNVVRAATRRARPLTRIHQHHSTMPTALSTTKRKFHRLLDTISSNASSTSLPPISKNTSNASSTTLPVTPAPPAKRTRLDRPSLAYVSSSKSLRPETRPLLQDARHSSTTPAPSPTPKKPPPNFAPWDREQFLQRLKTYRHVDKWLSKPDSINEVEWAKRGWSCVKKETVRCVGGCEQELVIALESERLPRDSNRGNRGEAAAAAADSDEESDEEWRDEAQKELVKKYAEMISSAHEGSCLWRRRGCDGTFPTPMLQV